ncbi:RNA methyltransferase [Flavobacteriaceae bacterium]|nr:RNA methyltransferase [Flavobacteriaceae bacterium]
MRKLKNNELDRKTVEEFKQASKTPLILILDNIRSLNNIGAVFRSSDAFLIEKIYLCGITAKPPHKDIHKTALGATETVAWEYVPDTLTIVEKLLEEKVTIFAIEQTENSLSLENFQPKKGQTHAFILGNEIRGVDQKVIDRIQQTIEIPQLGSKHSFNISVAAGIVLWDFFFKFRQH